MQVRETGTVHSPPFWASASNTNASNPSPTSPYSTSSPTQSGIKPWIIVLLFSIVLLLFLPSILSTPFKSGRFSLSIKSGWDVLNLCLVVFAILCGFLGRIGDGSGSRRESGSYKQPRSEWTGFENPTAGMRRTRNSSSYPDLRLDTDVWGQNRVPDSWRFFDDAELYRNQRPVQLYGVSGQGEEERECRTIPVDTERFPLPQLEQRVENETNFEQVKMESGTIYEEEKKGSQTMVVRRRRRSLEALPKWEEVETEPMVTVGRRRRRSLERFPSIEEVDKEANFQNVQVHVEEEVDKRQMAVRRRRKSLENFPKMNEIEEETKFEEDMVEKESEPAARKANSSEELPEIEEIEQDTNFEENVVEKPPLVVEVAPPSPPPPPPPPLLPETKVAEECRKHKRSGSGGGAKDLASAITHFYQKKKQGNKSKRKEKHEVSIEPNPKSSSTTTTEVNSNPNSNPSTAAPPPLPSPPPSSIFYKFLSNKKAASKSRKIHSLSASTHSTSPSTVNTISTSSPPPLPPQPPRQGLNRSRKDQVASLGYRRIEDTELYENRRRERSNVSSYANYPLPPRSPLPPAPPPPPPVRENGSREQQVQKNGSVAVFCASPDVNDKADLFIKRFRDGLKMEIINSIKEKEKRKERQNEDHDAIHI